MVPARSTETDRTRGSITSSRAEGLHTWDSRKGKCNVTLYLDAPTDSPTDHLQMLGLLTNLLLKLCGLLGLGLRIGNGYGDRSENKMKLNF